MLGNLDAAVLRPKLELSHRMCYEGLVKSSFALLAGVESLSGGLIDKAVTLSAGLGGHGR